MTDIKTRLRDFGTVYPEDDTGEDTAKILAEKAADRIAALEAEVERLRGAGKRMLAHSCVADAGGDMKDADDHAAERAMRAALQGDKP